MFTPENTALVFPGQGSQTVGMAKEFMEEACTKQLFQEADDILGFPLSEMMREGSAEDLQMTAIAQPALLLSSYAAWVYFKKQSGKNVEEIACMTAGHSLGEYSALVVAEALNFETALQLVRLRGQAMQRAVPAGEGTMAAVIGLTTAPANSIANTAGCWVANDNSEGQVVFSGSVSSVDEASNMAAEEGVKRVVRLDVSAPFHCPLMQPAAEEMLEALDGAKIWPPRVPVIHNITVAPELDPNAIRKNLADQITGTVRWRETMRYMEENGIKNGLELGTGKVLTGLFKRGSSHIDGLSLSTPAQIDQFIENMNF